MFHAKHHKNHFVTTYVKEIQSFKTTTNMDAKQSKFNDSFFLLSLCLDEATSQLKKSIKVLEKEFERSQR